MDVPAPGLDAALGGASIGRKSPKTTSFLVPAGWWFVARATRIHSAVDPKLCIDCGFDTGATCDRSVIDTEFRAERGFEAE